MTPSSIRNAVFAGAVLIAGVAWYFQGQAVSALRIENERLTARIAAAKKERLRPVESPPAAPESADAATAELVQLRAQVEQMKRDPATSWQDRVEMLGEVLQQLPGLYVAEISLASEEDWLDSVRGSLETADDYRQALAKLREFGASRFARELQKAVVAYKKASDGKFPSEVGALEPYMSRKVDDALWRRFQVVPASTISNVRMGGEWIITQVSVVDPTYDTEMVVGPSGQGATTYGVSALTDVARRYKEAHGQAAADPALLLSYATTPREKAAIAAHIERSKLDRFSLERQQFEASQKAR